MTAAKDDSQHQHTNARRRSNNGRSYPNTQPDITTYGKSSCAKPQQPIPVKLESHKTIKRKQRKTGIQKTGRVEHNNFRAYEAQPESRDGVRPEKYRTGEVKQIHRKRPASPVRITQNDIRRNGETCHSSHSGDKHRQRFIYTEFAATQHHPQGKKHGQHARNPQALTLMSAPARRQ